MWVRFPPERLCGGRLEVLGPSACFDLEEMPPNKNVSGKSEPRGR